MPEVLLEGFKHIFLFVIKVEVLPAGGLDCDNRLGSEPQVEKQNMPGSNSEADDVSSGSDKVPVYEHKCQCLRFCFIEQF